jgi:hypothetical protein
VTGRVARMMAAVWLHREEIERVPVGFAKFAWQHSRLHPLRVTNSLPMPTLPGEGDPHAG